MQSSGETNADRGIRDIEPARLVDQRAQQASAVEAQLREEIERLQEANQRKDEFLATLAHQLRNPLAPIRNALSFMQVGGNDASAWARGVTIIDRQVANLTCLVDDLLDLSRIARGMVELHKQPTPLSAILDGALETSRPVMEAAGHALAVSGSPSVWLDVDGTRITQALANVLNNAAKYTPPGGKIRVMAEREGSTVAVHVEDTGIGIRPHELQSIFDVFTQDRRSPGTNGLGIGLTLAQRLIEMHGGTIGASSKGPGLGSTITLRLPCLPDALRPEPPAPPFPQSYGEVAQTVLVVDDNQDSTDSLVWLIEMLGHRCVGTYDAAGALERAAQIRPTLVFLDIGLPDKTGYDVARLLRASLGPKVVLVAMTGWSQPSDVAQALQAGFDQHLAKPIRLDDVRELLRRPPT